MVFWIEKYSQIWNDEYKFINYSICEFENYSGWPEQKWTRSATVPNWDTIKMVYQSDPQNKKMEKETNAPAHLFF